MITPEERRHLLDGPRPGELPTGVARLDLLAKCADPSASLQLIRNALVVVLDHGGPPWPEVEQWSRLLPAWFVESCAPEPSEEEVRDLIARWRALSQSEKERDEESSEWSLGSWLDWLQPENRDWFWWDASVIGDQWLQVQVELTGAPAPTGALRWLMRSAGATAIADGS